MKNLLLKLRNKLLNILFNINFKPRHWVHTIKYSLKDTGMPSDRLIHLVKDAFDYAIKNNLEHIKKERLNNDHNHIELDEITTFPGAHYRILNGLVRAINPRRVVEIGTWTGVSSLAILDAARKDDFLLTTFDILPWNNIKHTALLEKDFGDNFQQILGDLSKKNNFDKYHEILCEADLIFIDGPKDGVFEYNLIDSFKKINFKNNPIIFFDDINQIEMLNLWASIDKPKFDITSLGQFTGTGLIDWI